MKLVFKATDARNTDVVLDVAAVIAKFLISPQRTRDSRLRCGPKISRLTTQLHIDLYSVTGWLLFAR